MYVAYSGIGMCLPDKWFPGIRNNCRLFKVLGPLVAKEFSVLERFATMDLAKWLDIQEPKRAVRGFF